MQITESIGNRIRQIKERPILVGICGRAGSGKSSLSQKIKEELSGRTIRSVSYSGDWRFKLDSEGRKLLLKEKWLAGLDEYLRAANQFNWWDFEKIREDLGALKNGNSIVLKNAYNRENGKKDIQGEVPGIKDGVIFYENCILGGIDILDKLHIVILLNTPENISFLRLMEKDLKRRSFPDILARQLVTLYSENIFFKMLLEKFPQKLLICDSAGEIGGFPQISQVSQIPVPIGEFKETTANKGVIFCDLDGALIRHPSLTVEADQDMEIADGSSEKMKEFKERGYQLILTTSRPYYKIFGILNKLKDLGIEFDQIIADLPLGPRHLIQESGSKNEGAILHILKRNECIKDINFD